MTLGHVHADERGVATVEFALLLPLLLLAFIGANYLAEIVIVQSKVARAASSLARLAAMDPAINDDGWATYRTMTTMMLEPIAGNATVTLSSVGNAGDGLRVRWSDSTGAALAQGAAFAFPAGATAYAASDKNTLVAQVTLTHRSLLARIWNALPWAPGSFAEDQTYTDVAYALPRTGTGSGTDLWTRRVSGGVPVF